MSATFAREEALFSAVIALPPAEREAWLQRACGRDSGLRQRVDSLLEGFDAAASFMDAVTVGVTDLNAAARTADPDRERADRDVETLGAYRRLRLLGEGGSSLVYLAEQS